MEDHVEKYVRMLQDSDPRQKINNERFHVDQDVDWNFMKQFANE